MISIVHGCLSIVPFLTWSFQKDPRNGDWQLVDKGLSNRATSIETVNYQKWVSDLVSKKTTTTGQPDRKVHI